VIAPPRTASATTAHERRPIYRCDCGHVLQVFGRGRHRVYFEGTDLPLKAPVMDNSCPGCGDGLPGKKRR